MTAAQASGKIRLYQSVVGGLLLLILPLSYLFLTLGFPPQVTLYVSIFISVIALFTRLWIIGPLVNLPIRKFAQYVLVPVLLVSILSSILPIMILSGIEGGFIRFFAVCIVSLISITLTIYWIGLRNTEQIFMKDKFRQLICQLKGQ